MSTPLRSRVCELGGSLAPHEVLDPVRGGRWVLVLPDAYDRPAGLNEQTVCVAVAAPIGLDLLAPEFSVVSRPGGVFGAAMPKASVDHHSHARFGEHEVRAAADAGQQRAVDEVAETSFVQYPAHLQLGPGVSGAGARHPMADPRRGCCETPEAGTGERL